MQKNCIIISLLILIFVLLGYLVFKEELSQTQEDPLNQYSITPSQEKISDLTKVEEHLNKQKKLIAPSTTRPETDEPFNPKFKLPEEWRIVESSQHTITIETSTQEQFTLAFFKKKPYHLVEIWINENKNLINSILGKPGVQMQDTCIPELDLEELNIFDCGDGNLNKQYYVVNKYNDRIILGFFGQTPILTPERLAELIIF